jgi:hypothetical protein
MTTSTTKDGPTRTYRQRSPQVSGWLFVITAAVLLALTLLSWASHPAPTFTAWVCFGGVLSWAVLLRPSVELSQRGVVLHNVVRDVLVPWTRVDDVEHRWNLKIYTPEDDSYTAWAISSQAQRPRSGPGGFGGGLGGFGGGLMRGYGGGGAPGFGPGRQDATPGGDGGPDGTTADGSAGASQRSAAKVTAGSVARDIAAAKEEYLEARERGLIGPVGEGQVQTRWARLPIVGLVVTIAAVAILTAL